MNQIDEWLLRLKPPTDIPDEFSDRGLSERSKRLYNILNSRLNYNINNRPIRPRDDIDNLDLLL